MAAQVLIAHTGQCLQVDAAQFASLDDFKAWVSRQSSIPVQCIITLTPQGKPLRLQTIGAEEEIYVYDIRRTQAANSPGAASLSSEVPLPQRYAVSNPPNSIEDSRSLQSWQELFKTRRAWAIKVVDDCGAMCRATRERYGEMDVMMRCLDAAVANLEAVVKGLEPKYHELRKWATATQADYNTLAMGWEQYLSLARSISISPAMVRFMTGRDVGGGKGRPAKHATLEDLTNLETAKKSGRLAPAALRKFNTRVADLDRAASRLFESCDELLREFEQIVNRSAMSHDAESSQLLQDIEAVANKIDTDFQTTLEYTTSTRDVLQASKIAANHTERLLPSLGKRAAEMSEMLRYATQERNKIAAESVAFMRSITDITTQSSSVKSQIGAVSQDEELTTFDYLRLIQQVPYMYASFATEAVRRRDWFEKVKTDSSTLANEMALFQDEEVKRRRKWQRSVGDAYGPETPSADSHVPGLEVNLLGEDEQWPSMTKKELDEFLDTLQRQKADRDLIDDISKLISDVGSPTKQQTKRLRAFKNGSIHEAALGRSGLMIRGDDDVMRSLHDDKTKLESKLKTAESRVRRLEDLLHRQSQASRPTLGNLFQTPSEQLPGRRDSTSSLRSPRVSEDRRRSSDAADVPALLHRIQHLEGELNSEKERSALFEKDLSDRTTQNKDIKGQMEEVNSTKKDLLENMEALKREFMEERKSLEDEIKRLQARLEDTEDEIEHFGESRENEKLSYDEKVRSLELEVERLTKERGDDVLKAQGQVDFLRNEAKLQRERNEALEQQLHAAQDESGSLAKKLEAAGEAGETQLRTLKDLHGQFSPQDMVPDDLNDLIEGVTDKSADMLARIQGVEGDMSLLRSDLDLAQNTARDLRTEVLTTKERLAAEEMTSMRLRENLSEEKARVAALEGEVTDAREQLNPLRLKIADGETGSESLRKRLEEEEKRITRMSEQLASRQSQVGSLEEELRLFKDKFGDSQSKLASLTARFDARAERTKDLSQRLYSQNDRLCRLLERLGFSATRQGGAMLIQKIPRSERSLRDPNDSSDPSSSVRKSTTFSRGLADSADLELLHWMNSPDAEAESQKYEAYMAALGSFDTDAFSDTVYRRVKEIEHMARKLQRDSRAYREKAHSLQKDAHDKIAFRHFKEGDLALFLPTRNQTTGAWAAFNVGFPHYFLREQEHHHLRNREWLVARIGRIQERVVDLSKSLQSPQQPGAAETDSMNANDEENDNPFDLSDGLRWYLINAQEDKAGAPSTPGLAKTTVAANNVEAMADSHSHARSPSVGKGLGLGVVSRGGAGGIEGVSKTLSRSLESRRSSTGSRKATPSAPGGAGRNSALASETNSLRAAPADSPDCPSPSVQTATAHGTISQPQTQPQEPTWSARQSSEQQRSPERQRNNSHNDAADNKQPWQLQREVSADSTAADSASKRSVVWDSLWSLDVSYESGKKGK